jgi:hypothetical protein
MATTTKIALDAILISLLFFLVLFTACALVTP